LLPFFFLLCSSDEPITSIFIREKNKKISWQIRRVCVPSHYSIPLSGLMMRLSICDEANRAVQQTFSFDTVPTEILCGAIKEEERNDMV
jgi:hypothetical protein